MDPLLLVVDDEPAILRTISLFGSILGWRVSAYEDAESALEQLDTIHPDFILTDIRLPGIDGTEFARRIKSQPHLENVPTYLMSAYAPPDGNLPGDGFMKKPFDPDALERLLVEARPA